MSDDWKANAEVLCRAYVAAMSGEDLDALLALFSDNATATSPISGKQPARDFYAMVFKITHDRSMALKTVFIGASNPLRAAVHIAYSRTVEDGVPATVEGVDVFELTKDGTKFESATIIYDTAPVRSDFDGPMRA